MGAFAIVFLIFWRWVGYLSLQDYSIFRLSWTFVILVFRWWLLSFYFSLIYFYYQQAHAASAVLNFSENCTPEILTPYLDGIVSKLLVLLQVYWTNNQCPVYNANIYIGTLMDEQFSSPKFHMCVCQNGKQMVQEGALTALASVADSSQVFCKICFNSKSFVIETSLTAWFSCRSTSKNTMML